MCEEQPKPKRRRRKERKRLPAGTAPGTLISHTDAARPVISAICYGPEEIKEVSLKNPGEVRGLVEKWPMTWINVDGLGDTEVISALGSHFNLHQLALEDVLSGRQRAKLEEYDDHYFLVVQVPLSGNKFLTEQSSLFFGNGYVLTFQEQPAHCYEPVRERLRRGRKRIRASGADYLTYALVDAVIDSYFPVLEKFGEALESVEEEVLNEPGPETLSKTHLLKRDLLFLRRVVWPQRDALSLLTREETPLIEEATQHYLRDCYDHAIRLTDMVDSQRELTSGLMDLHLSIVSNRMNEVMKVLTIIATIFIPLGFVAGLYGMNFDAEKSPWNMPELSWYFGYPLALALMAAVVLGLLVYFKRKNWL